MPDGNDKFSSWSGTNGVLVSSGQEPQTSSAPKTNYADINNNSSWDENVQKNPYKYNTSNANSKIYLTNDYNQYLTVQWSQKQAAKRYNIQIPKTQNPRYNTQIKSIAQMTEEEFTSKYAQKCEHLFDFLDTTSGVTGDGITLLTTPLGARIIQLVKGTAALLDSLFLEIRLAFEYFFSSPWDRMVIEAKAYIDSGTKSAIKVVDEGAKGSKLGKVGLALLLFIVVYRAIRFFMAPEDQKDNWGSKLRGAIYNLIISVSVEVASKSHPIALIITVVVAIADALIVYVTKGEADFGICFDLGLQWWGDKIKGWHKAGVDYFAETVIPYYVEKYNEAEVARQTGVEIMSLGFQAWDDGIHEVVDTISEGYDASVEYFAEDVYPFYEELGHDIAEGAENAAEVTSDYFTETVGPFWKEVGNDIADGVGNTWDKIVDQTKRSTESGNDDLPAWEVLGPSAGL